MARVVLTKHLRRFFPALEDGEVEGATVRAVVEALDRRHPGLAGYLVDDAFRLRPHVHVFINDEMVKDRRGLGDAVLPTDRVHILQALSGG